MATTLTRSQTRAKVRPRTCSRQQLLFTHEEMLQLLNDDLRRERKAVHAYSVFVEKLRSAGQTKLALQVEKRSKMVADHESRIEQLIRDFGGPVSAEVDPLNAILGADRVAQPNWEAETLRRLHDRARQLRTAGFPGFAKRMTRIIAEMQYSPDLAELMNGSGQ